MAGAVKEKPVKELVLFEAPLYEHADVPKNRNPNTNIDPLNINPRLAEWASEIIENRRMLNPSEQVRALAAIARIQFLFMKLREETADERKAESGTEVKRFAKAFATNAGRRRKGLTRRRNGSASELDNPISDAEDGDELEY